MGRLILVRHSLPQIDETKPARMWPLSPLGEQRSASLAIAVAALKPASIHSSAEAKATDTAQAIMAITGLALSIDPDFNEQDRSSEPFVDADQFTNSVADALRRPGELVYGSETVADAVERFSRGLASAERFSGPGDMVVVSHGTVIAAYVASRVGADPVELWQSLGMPGFVCVNWPEPEQILLRQNFE